MKHIVLSLITLLQLFTIKAQAPFSQKLLKEDTQHLINLLENSHPDPYSAFGGKVFFKLEAQNLLNSIPDSGLSLVDYQNYLGVFLSKLHDGHTYIIRSQSKKQGSSNLFIPIKLKIATDGLFVQDVAIGYKDLLGGKIVSINGRSLESLLDTILLLKPCENLFGAYLNLEKILQNKNDLKVLFPEFNDQLKFQVINPQNKILSKTIKYTESKVKFSGDSDNQLVKNELAGVFNYQFIDKDKKLMYFFIHEMFSKEVIEAIEKWKHPYMPSWGKSVLSTYYGVKEPYDFDKEIKRIPYVTEIVREMLTKMKNNKSSYLIIDLRENGGGYSFITTPILYMLYGDEIFKNDSKAFNIRILSQLYLDKIKMTLEEFNKRENSNYKLGDYFRIDDEQEKNRTTLEKRKDFENFFSSNDIGCLKFLEDLNGKAVYTPPKIIILTSPKTFSAAFHFVYDFWEMNKEVKFVGVPPAQAGNTFMESTPFKLTNTEVNGSISNFYQVLFPDDKERGETFWPNFSMKWADYKKYYFLKDAEIQHIMDLIKAGKL